jgi:hypothetical protein
MVAAMGFEERGEGADSRRENEFVSDHFGVFATSPFVERTSSTYGSHRATGT